MNSRPKTLIKATTFSANKFTQLDKYKSEDGTSHLLILCVTYSWVWVN